MITIDYFSDVLCVWAYAGQVRLDELQRTFGARIQVRQRFVNLFGDTATRIGDDWAEQGGFEGFAAHLREVCEQWEHTRLHPDAWTRCRPNSCIGTHAFLKAAAMSLGVEGDADADPGARQRFDLLVRETRKAFFEQGRDIARRDVLDGLLPGCAIDPQPVAQLLDSGAAFAGLHRDVELARAHGVHGSPTYLFNEGRQLLYGNVGFRIIEANLRELLEDAVPHGAPSWC